MENKNNFNKKEEKNKFIDKLWNIAEKGNFRPYSEFRKENNLSQ